MLQPPTRSTKPGSTVSPITRVLVVVPVRNEERRLAACLDAVDHAVRRVRTHVVPASVDAIWPVPRVDVVLTLDSCTDQSAAVAAAYPLVHVVTTRAGRVGAARALGARRGLALGAENWSDVWVATTDADSRVPSDWLTHQLDLAQAGADVYCGLVEPDQSECGAATYKSWAKDYQRVDGHPHVHGANLGVRAECYLRCGGFDPRAVAHEDVGLVRRALDAGFRVVASSQGTVSTSGRLTARVGAEGFAAYLASRTPWSTHQPLSLGN